jgi:RES domain
VPRRRYPRPPQDFAGRDLPLETVPKGTTFIRIHRSDLGALYFGTSGDNRFDDPERVYGVCYLALTREGAFAETCLRAVGAQFVAASYVSARSFTAIETTAPLRLVAVHGPGLARIGATSVVSSGEHALAQQWSRAIYDHPAAPDGLLYRANHDNGELCAALFERSADRLIRRQTQALLSDRASLAALLDRYRVGLG